MLIQISEIKVNPGRRETAPEHIKDLADSISKLGLLNPITIDQGHTLISGLHRLEAAKMLGWTEIECTLSNLEGLLAELAEIDENLIRRGLDYIDEGQQLARRKEIYEALHPETKQGGDRKSEKIKTKPFRFDSAKPFTVDTSEKTGISRRSIEQKIQVATGLTPQAKDIVRENGIGFKKALTLSRLPPDQQEDAARQLVVEKNSSINTDKSASAEPSAPEAPTPQTAPGEKRFLTFAENVADLKDPNKDCSCTPDDFLGEITSYIRNFNHGIEWYITPSYTVVFPDLTPAQVSYLRELMDSVYTILEKIFNQVEGSIKE